MDDIATGLESMMDLRRIWGCGRTRRPEVFLLTVDRPELSTKLLTCSTLRVKGLPASVSLPSPRRITLMLDWLSPLIPDSFVTQAFQPYGRVIAQFRLRCNGSKLTHSFSDRRKVTIDIKDGVDADHLPPLISVRGVQVAVFIPGRGLACFRCFRRGHTRRECSAVRCPSCSVWDAGDHQCSGIGLRLAPQPSTPPRLAADSAGPSGRPPLPPTSSQSPSQLGTDGTDVFADQLPLPSVLPSSLPPCATHLVSGSVTPGFTTPSSSLPPVGSSSTSSWADCVAEPDDAVVDVAVSLLQLQAVKRPGAVDIVPDVVGVKRRSRSGSAVVGTVSDPPDGPFSLLTATAGTRLDPVASDTSIPCGQPSSRLLAPPPSPADGCVSFDTDYDLHSPNI